MPIERTIMAGVSAVDQNVLYLTTANGGGGAGLGQILKSTDGAVTFKVENATSSLTKGLIFLGAAAASDDHAVVTGVLEDYYTADGYSFHNSVGPGLVNEEVLCAKVFPGKSALGTYQYGIAGHFDGVNGVGISETGGLNYKGYGPSKELLDPALYTARFADFPSADTWYVTYGKMPAPTPSPASDNKTRDVRLTDMITIHYDEENGNVRYSHRLRDWAGDTSSGDASSGDQSGAGSRAPTPAPFEGYNSAIAKTTDKGATWKVVYQSNSSGYYMNDISCINTEHCVAVAEGETGAIILTTRDGGSSWQKFQAEDHQVRSHGTCVSAKMLSESEVWAACGLALSQESVEAHYYHSLDGGSNWTMYQMPGMLPLSLSMSSPTSGYSTGIKVPTGTSMTLAKFSLTAPTFAPTPPPSPPRPGQTHYGDPVDGPCEGDEMRITVTGATGAYCAPLCTKAVVGFKCSTDLPLNTTASPDCAIADQDTGAHYW
jgi:hypothetical protein